MDGYMTPAAIDTAVRRLAELRSEDGVIRFIEGGSVAIWDGKSASWRITGSDQSWGNPVYMIKTFGPYEELGLRATAG